MPAIRSGIVDGAAAILIGNADFGKAHGLKPRARIRATAKIGTDPTIMLTGPVPVTEKILKDSGLSISDIDLFEVNEAFASVVLRFMQAFDVDPAKVNPNGGSIAMGHPLGATGAIIIGTLLDELERTGKGTGLATLCIASEWARRRSSNASRLQTSRPLIPRSTKLHDGAPCAR